MIAHRPMPAPDLEVGDADAVEEALWARSGDRRRIFVERVRSNPQLVLGASILLAFTAVAVFAMVRFGAGLTTIPTSTAFAESLHPPGPSSAHPFGVLNGLGADILDALVRATPVDLALVGGAILLAVGLGVLLGAWAGARPGFIDYLVTSGSDVVVGVPPFFLVIVLFLGLQRLVPANDGLLVFGLLFGLILWPYYARPVRAKAQQVAGEAYVDAARAAGATPGRLLAKHVIPNSFFPALAQVPVDVYNIFFVLTMFPFIGCFGGGANQFFEPITPLPAPTYPEWGNLLAQGACHGWSPLPELNFWWMYAFPALVVLVFGVAVALLCDGTERLLATQRPT